MEKDNISISGDTYHNRHSPSSPYKGNKKYKKKPNKCSVCGTTSGPFDLHHTSNNRNDLKSGKGLKVMCRSCHRKYHAKRNGGKGERIISSAARIVEDPKTKRSEALANSHKNSDLLYVEFILCHANINGNQDEFTSDDLEASASTIINKPVNWEHKDHNIGVIYDSEFIAISKLEDEAKAYYKDFDPLEDDFVICKAAIWEYKHPSEARVMRDRAEDSSLAFSMENNFEKVACSECKEVYGSFFDYCDHLITRKQTKESSRIFINSNLIGAAVTKNPADEDALYLAIANEKNKNSFAEIIKSSFLIDTNITKIMSFIALGGKDMKITKVDIPQEISSMFKDFIDLPDEAFADNINRLFPIDICDNIEASASLILNEKYDFYNDNDKLVIVERLAKAAGEYDVDLSKYVQEGGNEPMSIDKNSPEFKQALAEALQVKVSELESGGQIKELEDEASKATKEIETLTKQVKTLGGEKAEAEKKFTEYKSEVETEKLAEARFKQLSEAGFSFKDEDSVKTRISIMDEDAFAAYFSDLNSVVAKFKKEKEDEDEELKKNEKFKKKDKKDKDKDKDAKADEDPVVDSNKTAVASKVDDDAEDEKFSAIDDVIKSSLGL